MKKLLCIAILIATSQAAQGAASSSSENAPKRQYTCNQKPATSGSIQDLINTHRVPKFTKENRSLTLNLSNIDSLQGLENIPGIETVESLNLSKTRLLELPSDAFTCCPELGELNISDNPYLSKIASRAISGLKSMYRLSIAGNPQLTELPADIFEGLKIVYIINLKNNNLTDVKPGTFNKNLHYLQAIVLTGNPLTQSEDKKKRIREEVNAIPPTKPRFIYFSDTETE